VNAILDGSKTNEELVKRMHMIRAYVIPAAEDTIKVTAGVTGSGTVACRLRNELICVVREVKFLTNMMKP